jgi:hypothetical protein
MAVKIINAWIGGNVIANPSAGPNKGPVQGVATSVARTPLIKEFLKGDKELAADALLPREIREVPISNTPKRLNPSRKSRAARIATNTGSCN